MSDIAKIPTAELVHDYLESYMDIARLELAVKLEPSAKVADRLQANKRIVQIIVHELVNRNDTTIYDRRELILGRFST